MLFKELGLSDPILRSLEDLKHSEPSEIQKQAIPIVLSGKNIMAAAQTGTGKTGSFVLPMIELLQNQAKPYRKHVHALVLTPTRELAAQSERVFILMENLPLPPQRQFLVELRFFLKNLNLKKD